MKRFESVIVIKLVVYFMIILCVPMIFFALSGSISLLLFTLTGVTTLIIGLVLSVAFARDVVKPLNAMAIQVERFIQHDLTSPPVAITRDEGGVGGQVEKVRETLHDTLSTVNEVFQTTSSSAEQIVSMSANQSKWVSEQSSYILEISTTMEELNTSAQMVFQKADHLFKQAEETLSKSRDGQEALTNSTTFMNDIKDKVQDIASRIMSLREQAQAIDQIISTVSDIAEKTDILAINAAIEAVKAGEYGKGFGVVAVEIRKLADQSKKASAKIVSKVGEIQAATNNSVMAAEEGEKSVIRGIQLIDTAGETVISAMQTFQDTVSLANEIRLASREQSVATSQIADGTQQINQVFQKMDASFKETVDSIKFLAENTETINSLLSLYKL